MITRIKPRPLIELARRDLPGPLDVINLITPSRFDRYRWYALLVFPAMSAVGGRVLWMARHEASLHGEVQAQKFLIVRYPSQRHFLAMTLNPYYLTINRLREAGVSRFEGSFTHASVTAEDLHRRRRLLAVHFTSPAGQDALAAIGEVVGSEPVYATRAVASLGFLDPPVATDPNPLSFGELALFALAEDEQPDVSALAAGVAAVTDAFSLQSYVREPRRTYRPSFRTAPDPALAPAAG